MNPDQPVFLSESQIRKRLEAGELFRPGTWLDTSLRRAGYDLRIASDVMVVPQHPGEVPTLRYPEGTHRTEPIRLEPGDSALVSSEERLAVPFDVGGNLGGTFSLIAQGVLVLTGLLLDPGYGMHRAGGVVTPSDNTRLHFLLACIGSDPVELQPGDVVAAVQFFQVEPMPPGEPLGSPGGRSLESRYFDPQAPARPLVLFSAIRQARQEAEETDAQLKKLEARVNTQVAEFDRRLAITEGGSKQVTMFGVFLVSVTLLGAALVALVDTVTSFETKSDSEWAVAIAAMVIASATVVIFTGWLAKTIAATLGKTDTKSSTGL